MTSGRRWFGVFAGLFLLFQFAMPLAYYFGDQAYDERFSWRMFSPVHLERCSIDVVEQVEGADRKVPLWELLPAPWVNILARFRPTVVDSFLHWRCEEPGIAEVRYTRTCQQADGSVRPPKRLRLACGSAQVEELPAS